MLDNRPISVSFPAPSADALPATLYIFVRLIFQSYKRLIRVHSSIMFRTNPGTWKLGVFGSMTTLKSPTIEQKPPKIAEIRLVHVI